MTCGIYKITLIEDGRCYVGQSIDIESRWKRERSELRNGKFNGKSGHHLQCAWAKYGEDAFTFEIAEVVDVDGLTDAEKDAALTAREQWWMDNTESEFNKRPAAGSMRGYRFTDEQRARLSESRKKIGPLTDEHRANISRSKRGVPLSPAHVARIAAAHRGKTLTAEHRAKIGEAGRGRVMSAATRAKLSEANKGQVPWSKGKIPSPETRAKLSEANRGQIPWNKGKKLPPEYGARISAAKRGWNPSAVTRSRMSASHIGKPWSALRRERHEARKAAREAAREAAKDTDQGG